MIYRNLAKVSGHQYYSMEELSTSSENATMVQDMLVDKEKFVDTLGFAIRGMYHRGTLSLEV